MCTCMWVRVLGVWLGGLFQWGAHGLIILQPKKCQIKNSDLAVREIIANDYGCDIIVLTVLLNGS